MLAVMIISLVCVALILTIICGAHSMTKKMKPNSANGLYTFLYIVLITIAAGIITLYLN